MTSTTTLVDIHNVSKSFAVRGQQLPILIDISCSIGRGEKVAIVGPSGSGKSTLLSLLGLLDTPTTGTIHIDGSDTGTLSSDEQATFRNTKIGFIFQSFELITPFTVYENITTPRDIAGLPPDAETVSHLLNILSINDRRHAMPATLSGGERQRVAIARALSMRPPLLLADEPTGSLDRATGTVVLDLLLAAVRDQGTTLIIITHDESVAARMDRVFTLQEGRLYERE